MEPASPIGQQNKESQIILHKSYILILNQDKYLLTLEINSNDILTFQLEKLKEISFCYYKKEYKYEELIDSLILHKQFYINVSTIFNYIETAITNNKVSLIQNENKIKILIKKNQEFDEIDCYLDLDEIELTKEEMLNKLFNETKQINLKEISNNNKEINLNKIINKNKEEKMNCLNKENEEIKNLIKKIILKNKELKDKLNVVIEENKKIKEENEEIKQNNKLIIEENKKLRETLNEYKKYFDENINNLKKEINNLNNCKNLFYHKYGEKGMVTNHPHELIFCNIYSKDIAYGKDGWICNICNKSFKFSTPNFYCDQCHFDICNNCFELYKRKQ